MMKENNIDEARNIYKRYYIKNNQKISYLTNFTHSDGNSLPEMTWIMFEKIFTQGFHQPSGSSNACTLICIWFAYYFSKQNGFLDIYDTNDFYNLVSIIFTVIHMGNNAHKNMVKRNVLEHPYYATISQALENGGNEIQHMKEVTFQQFNDSMSKNLPRNMIKLIQKFFKISGLRIPCKIHMVLIAHYRTVIFNFYLQDDTANSKVLLFDSHDHQYALQLHDKIKIYKTGLLLAQATLSNIDELCKWYTRVIQTSYKISDVKKYEISVLRNTLGP